MRPQEGIPGKGKPSEVFGTDEGIGEEVTGRVTKKTREKATEIITNFDEMPIEEAQKTAKVFAKNHPEEFYYSGSDELNQEEIKKAAEFTGTTMYLSASGIDAHAANELKNFKGKYIYLLHLTWLGEKEAEILNAIEKKGVKIYVPVSARGKEKIVAMVGEMPDYDEGYDPSLT